MELCDIEECGIVMILDIIWFEMYCAIFIYDDFDGLNQV
jgi:hypothetical protein